MPSDIPPGKPEAGTSGYEPICKSTDSLAKDNVSWRPESKEGSANTTSELEPGLKLNMLLL